MKYVFKVLLLGDAGVGKTSLIMRFVHNKFKSDYLLTIGMNVSSYQLEMDGTTVNLSIHDIGGQKRFEAFRQIFYKGSSGAIIVYDITREASFRNVLQWAKELRNECKHRTEIVLVGNKVDLEDLRAISSEEGIQQSEQLNATKFIETSAKLGHNVVDAFEQLARVMIQAPERKLSPQKR